MPEQEILGSVNKVLFQTLIIFAGIFLLSLLIILLFSKRITHSIKALTTETKKFSNFDLDEVQHINTKITEIDSMSKAIMSATTGLQSFRKYVPEVLVKQLIELGEEANIGGQEAELTIFFSDITDFTSIAERIHPQALMLHLSEYLEELSTIIVSEDGTIDKYIGDAIMAFWGAPLQQINAPYLACKSALRCQKRNHALNLKWQSERKPELKTRIGLHTGQTIVGNVGSSVRINYSIIGDSVNLAARLESINKTYGTEIIISEATYYLIKDNFTCRMLDIVAVKGKQKGAQIFELLHENGDERPLYLKPVEFYEQYESALTLYLAQNWLAAREQFEQLIKTHDKDLSVNLMIQRCTDFIETNHSFPEDWDGVIQLNRK